MTTKNTPIIEPTYYDLLNIFYQSGFPATLKPQATVVAHAIMFKWNSLYRPASFRMANKELEYLSGVHTHIGRWRQHVCDDCRIDETPLFIYVSNGQKSAGTYKINTIIIPNKYHNNTIIIPNRVPEVNDPREEDSIGEKNKKEASDPVENYSIVEEDAREPNIYLTVRRKIQIKYPLMKLTETDVGRIINKSKEPFYEGGKIDYWFHIIDKMPEWDKLEIQNVYGILAYGERAWPDYKKAHNIQAFFGS